MVVRTPEHSAFTPRATQTFYSFSETLDGWLRIVVAAVVVVVARAPEAVAAATPAVVVGVVDVAVIDA